jgi:hypothetical protein
MKRKFTTHQLDKKNIKSEPTRCHLSDPRSKSREIPFESLVDRLLECLTLWQQQMISLIDRLALARRLSLMPNRTPDVWAPLGINLRALPLDLINIFVNLIGHSQTEVHIKDPKMQDRRTNPFSIFAQIHDSGKCFLTGTVF